LLAIALSASCIPAPHRAFRTPIIHGRLMNDGGGLDNIPVRVVASPTDESSCSGRYTSDTRTDARGHFALCPMPDFQMFMYMMAHSRFRWNVCANVQGQWVPLQHSNRYTLSDSGPREIERLECRFYALDPSCNRSTDGDITPEKIRAALGSMRCAGVRGR
jgi:hypothetical protein